jgi:uncharacterized protein YbjQ (UPF0145 family)
MTIDVIIGLGSTFGLLMLALYTGSRVERRHNQSLAERENTLRHMLVTDLKRFPTNGRDVGPDAGGALVMGEVVIATDYLKSFLAGLRNILGGELKSYQSLVLRARRESMLRMLEEADQLGFNAVCNIRYGTADIGGMASGKGGVQIESFISGTAYRVTG